MNYPQRLIADPTLAAKELAEKLKAVTPPIIYGSSADLKVPQDILAAFIKLVDAAKVGGSTQVAPGLLILGKPGTGKSRAIYALAQLLLKEYWAGEHLYSQVVEPMMVEHVEWVQAVRESARFGDDNSRLSAKAFINDVKNWDGFLFLDDIGVSTMTDFISEQFYMLVDHRLKNWKPTVFVSNATEEDLLNAFDPRIGSRFARWTTKITFKV